MTAQVFEMDLVEYRDGDAFFECERLAQSDVSFVLPFADWRALGQPAVVRVSVEAAK